MPRTIEQVVTFRTTPERLYRLYLSPRQHTAAIAARPLEPARREATAWPGVCARHSIGATDTRK